jgi:hypothetical protein
MPRTAGSDHGERLTAGRPDSSQGVFETLRNRAGAVIEMTAHLQRLADSVAELYGCQLPGTLPQQLIDAARAVPTAGRLRVLAVPASPDGLRVT